MCKRIADCEQDSIYEALGKDNERLREYKKEVEQAVRDGEAHYEKTVRIIGEGYGIPRDMWNLIREELDIMTEELAGQAKPRCTCGNLEMGFDCMCDWMKKHPGSTHYYCEYCGIYQASKPRCNRCEEDQD